MQILFTDEDRDAVAEALFRACLEWGVNPEYRHRLADAALHALTTHRSKVTRAYVTEGHWSRPARAAAATKE